MVIFEISRLFVHEDRLWIPLSTGKWEPWLGEDLSGNCWPMSVPPGQRQSSPVMTKHNDMHFSNSCFLTKFVFCWNRFLSVVVFELLGKSELRITETSAFLLSKVWSSTSCRATRNLIQVSPSNLKDRNYFWTSLKCDFTAFHISTV